MRFVIQRVINASVTIAGEVKAAIGPGLLIFIGIEDADGESDIEWAANKICALRIFNNDKGVMNLSLVDTAGEALVVSQFTLMASVRKGNRPSYVKASAPAIAVPLYEKFIATLSSKLGKTVMSGEFGAYMKVALVNDGPVTIIIDTKNRNNRHEDIQKR